MPLSSVQDSYTKPYPNTANKAKTERSGSDVSRFFLFCCGVLDRANKGNKLIAYHPSKKMGAFFEKNEQNLLQFSEKYVRMNYQLYHGLVIQQRSDVPCLKM